MILLSFIPTSLKIKISNCIASICCKQIQQNHLTLLKTANVQANDNAEKDICEKTKMTRIKVWIEDEINILGKGEMVLKLGVCMCEW